MKRCALLLVVLAACSKDNPYYCDDCMMMPDAADDGSSPACTTSNDCSGATPVCDTSQNACVACTASEIGACGGDTPICVAATSTCAACTTHSECASDACLPSGACGTDDTVAYVAMTGTDTGTCTMAAPCLTLTYAASQRSYVKLQNDIDEAVVLASRNVTVIAEPGTRVRNTNGAPVITVSGTSNVTLLDLMIRDGATSTGHGISVGNGDTGVHVTLDRVAVLNNAGNGLSFLSGELTVSRSVVSGNLSGGAKIDATFNITNSLFVENGSGTVTLGGLSLTPGTGTNTFAFNTVATNHSSSGSVASRGINCTMPVTISSSIVSDNLANGCNFEYSLFDMGVTVNGATNRTGSAKFKYTDALSPMRDDYFRIQSDSDAIDGGAPVSSIMMDIDGDDRPQGGVRDIGADEYK